jgi:hypothetical protein
LVYGGDCGELGILVVMEVDAERKQQSTGELLRKIPGQLYTNLPSLDGKLLHIQSEHPNATSRI